MTESFTMIEIASRFLDFMLASFLLLSPMLLLGLFLAGLIHVFVSREAILKWLKDDSLKSVSTSAAFGVPVPLCSCSVVPVVREMRKKGASRSACMSFLITAPETGIDSILVTNAFFGWIAAIARPIISFITAVVAGIFCIGLIRDDKHDPNIDESQHDHDHGHHHHGEDCGHDHSHKSLMGGDDCYIGLKSFFALLVDGIKRISFPNLKTYLWLKPTFYRNGDIVDVGGGGIKEDAKVPEPKIINGLTFGKVTRHIFRYGFIEVADDILFALLVGLLIGGFLYLAIPADLASREYVQWLAYPVMVLFAVPLYICASASTPIAAALVAKGFSPGAALIFLMTGPATNTGTIAIILNQFGARFTSIYVGIVIAVTVLIGVAIDLLVISFGYSLAVNLESSDSTPIAILQWGSAFVLLSLVVWRFRAGALKSGYQDMMQNLTHISSLWGKGWSRITRGRGVRGIFSYSTPIGITLGGFIVVLYLATGFTTIPPQSVGYGKLFGKVHWKDLQPGLHYLAPTPFVKVDKWPVREVKSIMSDLPIEYFAGDLNLLTFRVNIQYRVVDPYVYHYKVSNPEAVITNLVGESIRHFVSSRGLEPLLNIYRVEFENNLTEHLTTDIMGEDNLTLESLELVKANLISVQPIDETMYAFREVSSAQEDRERLIATAQRFLVWLTPLAHGNSFFEIEQAKGISYRNVTVAAAEADAIIDISESVKTAPDVLRNMLWREKLETALAGRSKILVPDEESLNNIVIWKHNSQISDSSESHAGDGHQ